MKGLVRRMPSSAGNQCVKCGFQNEEPVDYCVSCGENLRARCLHCHAPVRSNQSYCGKCGQPLGAALGGSSRIQTPQHLAERIRSAEGERKIATVLFADIAGSTSIAEHLDPEDWTAVVGEAFTRMNRTIERYDGTIARLMGDGVLAFFGAPQLPAGPPALRASRGVGCRRSDA